MDRDKKILSHISKYDGITIKQCYYLFFSDSNFGYDLARKRLNLMVKDGFVKVFKDKGTNENVYYTDKKMKYREIIAMTFYAKLVYSGVNVTLFIRNYTLYDGKFSCDAFCTYEVDGKESYMFVEVILNYNEYNFTKYEWLYETQAFQQLYKGQFPRLIVIENIDHIQPLELPNIKVTELNLQFKNFAKVFID